MTRKTKPPRRTPPPTACACSCASWQCDACSTWRRPLCAVSRSTEMQKIARIYLGSTGFSAAWYDGVMFDMVDPHTGEPTDVVINLENGGGKSSLLSLIFSCFETSRDRFLK